nr:hypothetical protein [Kineosporia mesophila]
MGEASVAFVVTGPGRRPDHSYFGVLGGAMTHDAHHVTSIEPELNSVRQCFERALRAGGVRADDVRYLNAHGPGTLQCDSAEATILDEMFTPDTWIYSLKPLLGHCQGASAAAEIAVAALAAAQQVLPLAPQVAPGHERLLSGTHHLAPGLVAKSALGMGGHNAVVLLQPPSQN